MDMTAAVDDTSMDDVAEADAPSDATSAVTGLSVSSVAHMLTMKLQLDAAAAAQWRLRVRTAVHNL